MSNYTDLEEPIEKTISDRPMIQLSGVDKWFGDFQVLKDINLTVNKGKELLFVVHLDQVNQH